VVGASTGLAASANRVLVYYGGPGFTGAPGVNIVDPLFANGFGFAVAGAGDVNGDGYADIVAGSPTRSVGGRPGVGQAFVYFGGPRLDTTPDLTLSGENADDNFGASVAGAGDLDGDGFADLVIGAPKSDASGADAGRVYVYFGGPHPDSIADARLDGEASLDNLGIWVAGAGDPDLGGSDAFLVGASQNDAGASNAGRAYLARVERYRFLEPHAGDGWLAGESAVVRWTGSEPADLDLSLDGTHWQTLAANVGGAADNQLTITAPDAATGRARLRLTVRGRSPGAGSSAFAPGPLRITRRAMQPPAVVEERGRAAAGADRFGSTVALGVDWNGDGRPDVIGGAPQEGNGAIHVLDESGGGDSEIARLTGAEPLEQFGAALADVGDMDRDGWHDLAVGAPACDASGANAGRVYVFRGGPSSDGVACYRRGTCRSISST